ncbi:MAG: hypothetical protein A2358_01645 [Candidatus Staskawiczbacteria bacterium RIFOXYB1_FULL_37_44]|uniref:Uncharacterized protein n=1 Tax=Candidatus Staskawiczbacteria bacterium RIFOXYB1_FULL_37_44 TaxID=1802223 RepID=A0A1G2IXR8_9BACT|nr:MAG: hypothetical protein A2358_01645 [Candidatus Staskawiczbacteria bacterium RIFOXYB1_FULL_37_44]OGZ83409.1 MAG: hypothetical protein A2416_02380 [Candidatus Staskawiczbacteria bacterium RIFOXYC1_FULL_37_52]OGZ88236.1 MAG: hypothetical protein A2444_00420 [Candidatus Staskawiczbacteria bacterium RIFOXYC2_FULL_37_19]OGZ88812.1 MAG: hypothetical protein A2581_03320 [Candidatus Staskawiczbacteria bacterium RIFOXYD1_FULL_37_110]
MQQILNNKYLFFGLLFLGFFAANFASAQVCPVCVVAIGAGLGFSRWLGIDDVVSSVWIGAFLIATISWTLEFMRKRKWNFHDDGIVITLAYILLTYIPLYYAGIVGHPQNQIWSLDKIITGSTIGASFLFIGHWLHLYLKKKNNNKVFFPYQRVAAPVVILIIVSLILWRII